jgi:hypothetical protein
MSVALREPSNWLWRRASRRALAQGVEGPAEELVAALVDRGRSRDKYAGIGASKLDNVAVSLGVAALNGQYQIGRYYNSYCICCVAMRTLKAIPIV